MLVFCFSGNIDDKDRALLKTILDRDVLSEICSVCWEDFMDARKLSGSASKRSKKARDSASNKPKDIDDEDKPKHRPNHDVVGVVKECGHHFHLDCLLIWLKENFICPMCRNSALMSAEHLLAVPLTAFTVSQEPEVACKDKSASQKQGSHDKETEAAIHQPDCSTVITNEHATMEPTQDIDTQEHHRSHHQAYLHKDQKEYLSLERHRYLDQDHQKYYHDHHVEHHKKYPSTKHKEYPNNEHAGYLDKEHLDPYVGHGEHPGTDHDKYLGKGHDAYLGRDQTDCLKEVVTVSTDEIEGQSSWTRGETSNSSVRYQPDVFYNPASLERAGEDHKEDLCHDQQDIVVTIR